MTIFINVAKLPQRFNLIPSHHLSCRLPSPMYSNQASKVGKTSFCSHPISAKSWMICTKLLSSSKQATSSLSSPLQMDIIFSQGISFEDLEIFSLFHRHSSSTIHQNQLYHWKLNPLMFVDRIIKEKMLKCNI